MGFRFLRNDIDGIGILSLVNIQANNPPKRGRCGKEFYYQMGELGWFRDMRVELIDGEVYQMSPIVSHHAVSVILVSQALQAVLPESFFIYPQSPLDSAPRSEPVPDVAVIRGAVRDYSESLPQISDLVVEVEDSSFRHDRTVKAGLYASSCI